MRKTAISLLLVMSAAGVARAADVYYRIPLTKLEWTEGDPSAVKDDVSWRSRNDIPPCYVVLDGPGEAYLSRQGYELNQPLTGNTALCVRVPSASEITGLIVLPKRSWDGLVRLRFRVPAGAGEENAAAFERARQGYYSDLLKRGVPGGAWFRYRMGKPETQQNDAWRRESDMERTYNLFSGGRALSENLQLARHIPESKAQEPTVALASIDGIAVNAYDWAPRVEKLEVDRDPLAKLVPADQYAIFCPSFPAFLELTDLADDEGTPLLRWIEPRSEDALTRQRYERQLCVGSDSLTRLLGPRVVKSVVVTGSDPYLRTGSDLALIFQGTPELPALLAARRLSRMAASGVEGVRETNGTAHGVAWHAYVSPDRRVSSYMATRDDVVVLSNSRVQLERVLATAAGQAPSMGSLGEYTFFRHRYARGTADEVALLVLTDAAIRKWCGPRWRIGASRRLRALAEMDDIQARHLDRLVKDPTETVVVDRAPRLVDLGEVTLSARGARSTVYNTPEFLTPIAELDVERVTEREAQFYRRWRDGYQSNWSNYFDPIAVQVKRTGAQLDVDVTVMPLITNSEYDRFRAVVGKAKIGADAGDRHAETLAQFIFAVDSDSEPVREMFNFMKNSVPGLLKVNPLAWLGQSYTIYIDRDPFWDDAIAADNFERFLWANLYRLPVALNCEVKSPVKLVAFLASVRAWIEETAPGMTSWTALEHAGTPYVRIAPTKTASNGDENIAKIAIYYVVTSDSFTLSLNEDLVKRSIERAVARKEAKAEGKELPAPGRPWLGEHLALQVDRKLLDVYDAADKRDAFGPLMRRRSYENLPILNEFKRRYPDQDPVALYERFFGARLVCPGGGTYVWNEKWQTMESTVFGHPGEEKEANPPKPYAKWQAGDFGLTFEDDGLRARCALIPATTTEAVGGK